MKMPLYPGQNWILKPIDLLVGLATAIALLFTYLMGQQFPTDRLIDQLWNLGHICAYFVWTWYLTYRWLFLMRIRLAWRLMVLMGLTLGTGLMIEVLQLATGRSADGWDILRNLLGCALALWWTGPNARTLGAALRQWGRLLSIFLLLIAFYPFLRTLVDRVVVWHQVPVIVDHETPCMCLNQCWAEVPRVASISVSQ